MSLQVAILKVLASYSDGRATVAAMNSDLAILAGAGIAWSQRLKMLAARAPGLDIFSEGFVIRDSDGWQLTPAGRKALYLIEHPAPPRAAAPKLEIVRPSAPVRTDRARTTIPIVGRNDRRRRRRVAEERSA